VTSDTKTAIRKLLSPEIAEAVLSDLQRAILRYEVSRPVRGYCQQAGTSKRIATERRQLARVRRLSSELAAKLAPEWISLLLDQARVVAALRGGPQEGVPVPILANELRELAAAAKTLSQSAKRGIQGKSINDGDKAALNLAVGFALHRAGVPIGSTARPRGRSRRPTGRMIFTGVLIEVYHELNLEIKHERARQIARKVERAVRKAPEEAQAFTLKLRESGIGLQLVAKPRS
jgi:hypothetical protein